MPTMDIRGWLEGTADRAPPDGSDDRVDRDGGLRRDDLSLGPPPERQDYRKRKRASSDSSIIAPRRHGTRHAPASMSLHTASPDPGIRQKSPDARSRGSSSRRSSRPEADAAALRKYERRPRHKTRPDRYEAKRKKERKERKPRDDSKRRKSHRTHDGSRTTGLVQSFQLKNGPKHSRLTVSRQISHVSVIWQLTQQQLRADVNTGLFKHGRASAQVGGRGSGCMWRSPQLLCSRADTL